MIAIFVFSSFNIFISLDSRLSFHVATVSYPTIPSLVLLYRYSVILSVRYPRRFWRLCVYIYMSLKDVPVVFYSKYSGVTAYFSLHTRPGYLSETHLLGSSDLVICFSASQAFDRVSPVTLGKRPMTGYYRPDFFTKFLLLPFRTCEMRPPAWEGTVKQLCWRCLFVYRTAKEE